MFIFLILLCTRLWKENLPIKHGMSINAKPSVQCRYEAESASGER